MIHLGVDGEREFDPARVEPWSWRARCQRILWPGRLVEQKDPMLTLEVIARARERGAEFVLDIVGDGHLKEPARARAEELGVGEVIDWHPPSQEMAALVPQRRPAADDEPLRGRSLVIYESLAMGVPVVAPALPGNREFMDADSGVLIEPRDDVERYADAIVALLADEERRRQMGERSRRRMLEEFSLAEMGRRHDELYERLLLRTDGEQPLAQRRAVRRGGPETAAGGARRPAAVASRSCARAHGRSDRALLPARDLPRRLHRLDQGPDARSGAIVVVDDGSDDLETFEALARLDDDPEVTVLRQPGNRGPSAARNRALAQLETSYVLPIDADDELLPDALERMLAQLEAAPEDVGFVYPNCAAHRQPGRTTSSRPLTTSGC